MQKKVFQSLSPVDRSTVRRVDHVPLRAEGPLSSAVDVGAVDQIWRRIANPSVSCFPILVIAHFVS
jgi:hypothetical protein